MVRFKNREQSEAVRFAVESSPAVLAALGVKQLLKEHKKALQPGNDYVLWSWVYPFRKPRVASVTALAKALVQAVKGTALPFDGRCQMCEKASAPEITLLNTLPGHLCEDCQAQIRMEWRAQELALENQPEDFPMGMVLGSAAAVLGSLAWAGLTYLTNTLFLAVTFVIGWLVARAVTKGMGKINWPGRVLTCVLAVTSVVLGDAIFLTLSAMKRLNQPFSFPLWDTVLKILVQQEKEASRVASILFALLGAGVTLYRMRQPSFSPRFELLGTPE